MVDFENLRNLVQNYIFPTDFTNISSPFLRKKKSTSDTPGCFGPKPEQTRVISDRDCSQAWLISSWMATTAEARSAKAAESMVSVRSAAGTPSSPEAQML